MMMKERKRQCNNKSGYRGVTWHVREKKWQAVLQVDGLQKHLGYYTTPELARDAYLEAKALFIQFLSYA